MPWEKVCYSHNPTAEKGVSEAGAQCTGTKPCAYFNKICMLFFDFYTRSQNYEKGLLASLCPYVSPSVFRMEELSSNWPNCHEILYLSSFPKSVDKIQFPLKSDKNNRYFTRRHLFIYNNIALNSPYKQKCFRRIL